MSRGGISFYPELVKKAATDDGCAIGKSIYYVRKNSIAGGDGVLSTIIRIFPTALKGVSQVKLRTVALGIGIPNSRLFTIYNTVVRYDPALNGGVPEEIIFNADYNILGAGSPVIIFAQGYAATPSVPAHYDIIFQNTTTLPIRATTLVRVNNATPSYTPIPPRITYRGNSLQDSLRRETQGSPYSPWDAEGLVINYNTSVWIAANNTLYSLPSVFFHENSPAVGESLMLLDLVMCGRSRADATHQYVEVYRQSWTSTDRGVPFARNSVIPFGASSIGSTVVFTPVAGTSTAPPRLNITFTATSSAAVGMSLEIKGVIVLCYQTQ